MSGILRISEAVALGIHALAIIAENRKNKMSANQIAGLLQASEAHLAKVLQRLVKAEIIKSNRGPGGGFVLNKHANDITLMDVYQAIDGVFPEGTCLFKQPVCNKPGCGLRTLLTKVNSEVKEFFCKTTVADLL